MIKIGKKMISIPMILFMYLLIYNPPILSPLFTSNSAWLVMIPSAELEGTEGICEALDGDLDRGFPRRCFCLSPGAVKAEWQSLLAARLFCLLDGGRYPFRAGLLGCASKTGPWGFRTAGSFIQIVNTEDGYRRYLKCHMTDLQSINILTRTR